MTTTSRLSTTLSLMLALAACGDDGQTTSTDSDSDGAASDSDGGGPSAPVETVDEGEGVRLTTVDASSDQTWVYFDFESGAQTSPGDPADDAGWDLGFLRFNIKSNGGTSGTGEVGVVRLDGEDFDALSVAPAQGYVSDDAAGGPMPMSTTPGYAFDEWYAYDFATHVLSPEDAVFVVRTVEANYFKVQLLAYYDDAGTPGMVQFRWAPLDPPS